MVCDSSSRIVTIAREGEVRRMGSLRRTSPFFPIFASTDLSIIYSLIMHIILPSKRECFNEIFLFPFHRHLLGIPPPSGRYPFLKVDGKKSR